MVRVTNWYFFLPTLLSKLSSMAHAAVFLSLIFFVQYNFLSTVSHYVPYLTTLHIYYVRPASFVLYKPLGKISVSFHPLIPPLLFLFSKIRYEILGVDFPPSVSNPHSSTHDMFPYYSILTMCLATIYWPVASNFYLTSIPPLLSGPSPQLTSYIIGNPCSKQRGSTLTFLISILFSISLPYFLLSASYRQHFQGINSHH